jgi:hypothetical protein
MSSVQLVVVVQPADMMATRKIRSARHEGLLIRETQRQLSTPSPEVLSEMGQRVASWTEIFSES